MGRLAHLARDASDYSPITNLTNLPWPGNCAPTGDRPGVTRAVQTEIKVSENPTVYVFDTPGIMIPDVPSTELGLALALIGWS